MLYLRNDYQSIPHKSGVYVYLDKDNMILYVGKAKDLKHRVSSYFLNTEKLYGKTKIMVARIAKIRVTIVESELEALLLEAFYIKKYKPKYNVLLKDSKAYVMIKITKDTYPKVLLTRNQEDPHATYYGPYPNSSAVRVVLKTIRKIFPYQSVRNHQKRICLYNHLGLCPCPPVFDSRELKKEYRKNIRGITRMLEGESQQIQKELTRDRDVASNEERYEEALTLQKKINALQIVTQPFHNPIEYDVNPNLRTDIRAQEKDELIKTLNEHGYALRELKRIECYDISNIQGTNAVGSMVVLTNGEIDTSEYRKFKIRRENTPNDFAMMKEVLKRRFSRNGWIIPDLLIVDGGKGQVSAAFEALISCGVQIPLIGLAKREETIIVPVVVPNKSSLTFEEISLPKNSKALHLIMRIRDEAHRFAITYHRQLRSKQTMLQ
jgi:excinuclease ABC subunit C